MSPFLKNKMRRHGSDEEEEDEDEEPINSEEEEEDEEREEDDEEDPEEGEPDHHRPEFAPRLAAAPVKGQKGSKGKAAGGHKMPSNKELMSSAKVVALAAKSALSKDPANKGDKGKMDKGKMAGATADLLAAASHYGKLEESAIGKYMDKAENFLHKYETKSSTKTTDSSDKTTTITSHSETVRSDSGDPHHGKSGSGGGYGDYLKMAQGSLKK